MYRHGFWVINMPGSRTAEGGNFRPIYLERHRGHVSEEWAFSITWYWFQKTWIWPCYSSNECSLAVSCAQGSRYLWLEIREGLIHHSCPSSEGDGFCSARGSSSSQPSQLQRKCSALWFLQVCRKDKMSDSNFFFPSLFKWHLPFF